MKPRLLLEAADSVRRESEPENRLTEILAAVLRASPRLVSWLAARAWSESDDDVALGWTANGYDVLTQVSVPGGGRPDMRIDFRPGGCPGPVYCESKIGAGPTYLQAQGYQGIAATGGRLVVLSPSGCPLPTGDSTGIRWQALADRAQLIGRVLTTGMAAWRDAALRPDATAECRMLAELLGYLERLEGVNVTGSEAITQDDLGVIAVMRETRERWDELAKRVFSQCEERGLGGERQRWHPENLGPRRRQTGWELYATAPWQALDQVLLESQIEEPVYRSLILEPSTSWHPGGGTDPAVTVNASVWMANLPAGLREGGDLRTSIEAEGFQFGNTLSGKITRIFDSRLVADFDAPNLSDQAESIVAWAQDRLDVLFAISGTPGGTAAVT